MLSLGPARRLPEAGSYVRETGDLDLDALLAGTIIDAWGRCLPLWRTRGRVEDLPRNVRKFMYRASQETLLGRAFAAAFRARVAAGAGGAGVFFGAVGRPAND